MRASAPRDGACSRRDRPAHARAALAALARGALLALALVTTGAVLAFVTRPASAQVPLCNPNPFANQLLLTPARMTPEAFVRALVDDPAFRERMGGVVPVRASFSFVVVAFPELDDPRTLLARLMATGEFANGGVNDLVCGLPPPDVVGRAVEYYNAARDHYFLTADVHEQGALDTGVIAGWTRTGEQFTVVLHPGCAATWAGWHPVYRFYREPIGGPDTHFFGADEAECGWLRERRSAGWVFEGAPFWVRYPAGAACPEQAVPLFRAYNNGQGGAANHRYSTKQAVIDAMVGRGWIDEGLAMCVRAP